MKPAVAEQAPAQAALPAVFFSFATTNEEPEVELQVIKMLAQHKAKRGEDTGLRVVHIPGCGLNTVCIASRPEVRYIDAIDSAENQVRSVVHWRAH